MDGRLEKTGASELFGICPCGSDVTDWMMVHSLSMQGCKPNTFWAGVTSQISCHMCGLFT